MDLRLKGRRVLITGASRGIGEGAAEAFAAEGCDLVLAARDADRLKAVADRLRSRCSVVVTTLALDLTDSSALERLATLDGVDILVNNAGAIPGGDLQTVDAATWRRAWNLKVYGYIDLCRLFYAKMKAQGGGVIINNIGASAEFFDPAYIAGSSGNAALVAFTRTLGAQSLDDAIRVVGVSPVRSRRSESRSCSETGARRPTSQRPSPWAGRPLSARSLI